MAGLRARVHNGRLLVDEPTGLPEGTVLDLVVDDEGDELDEADRAALKEGLARSLESLAAGRGRPMRELLDDLGRR